MMFFNMIYSMCTLVLLTTVNFATPETSTYCTVYILTYEGYIDFCDVYWVTDSYRKTGVVQYVLQMLQHFKVNSTDLKFNYVFIELWWFCGQQNGTK